MAITVDFRAVGIYAFFPSLVLHDLDGNATILQVLSAVRDQVSGFTYEGDRLANDKEIVMEMSYDYSGASQRPPNTSVNPSPGFRRIKTTLDDPDNVIQYYKGARAKVGGTEVLIRNPTLKQPSFATETISNGLHLPSGAELLAYTLTFRNVVINLSPMQRVNYLAAKLNIELKKAGASDEEKARVYQKRLDMVGA